MHLQLLAIWRTSANSDSNARLDVQQLMALGEEDFSILSLMLRVFNLGAPSNHPFKLAYCCHKREKRRLYEQHLCEVENGHFIPLVFTAIGEWVSDGLMID